MENYCNRCPTGLRGICCWYSMYDGTDNFVVQPCEYLSKKTKRCKDYKNRFKINPNCLTVEQALIEGALPLGCPYVMKSDVIPIRPNKTVNIKKMEMIKNGNEEGRFRISDGIEWIKGIASKT
ncbi:hypothetical protein LCGC14_1421650 [marine sediment metagenome]|uniref:Uncharacterized protein n=1 Tax=marine sediment metagenome TaxID=412755 RepID=A0A0F9M6R7_9ZZZZ